jgi:hypothetical protein
MNLIYIYIMFNRQVHILLVDGTLLKSNVLIYWHMDFASLDMYSYGD